MRAFAEALDSVPMALAENSGLRPIETLASIKSRQIKEKNPRLGVDCMQTGSNGGFLSSYEPHSLLSHPIMPFSRELVVCTELHRSSTANNYIIDMKEHFVIDPLIGKRQQLLLATQLCRMVLKVLISYLRALYLFLL